MQWGTGGGVRGGHGAPNSGWAETPAFFCGANLPSGQLFPQGGGHPQYFFHQPYAFGGTQLCPPPSPRGPQGSQHPVVQPQQQTILFVAPQHDGQAQQGPESGQATKPLNGDKRKSSKYRGVSWHRRDKSWTARIWNNGKSEHLGTFSTELRAALSVDVKAEKYFGKGFTEFNFPDAMERRSVLKALIGDHLPNNMGLDFALKNVDHVVKLLATTDITQARSKKRPQPSHLNDFDQQGQEALQPGILVDPIKRAKIDGMRNRSEILELLKMSKTPSTTINNKPSMSSASSTSDNSRRLPCFGSCSGEESGKSRSTGFISDSNSSASGSS